jgi:ATP-dependent DNA ligase I
MKNKKQTLQIGTPVKPMLVSETGSGDERYEQVMKYHNNRSFVEVKSDGYRVQVHKAEEVSLYTRSLNYLSPELFPELAPQLQALPYGIFDGELVGVEDGIKGFNSVKKRVRGELDKSLVSEYPLQIKFFDVLNLDGDDHTSKPLYQRRQTLEGYVGNISDLQVISEAEVLQQRFDSVIEQGLEGLVCKNPDSGYLIGKRTKDWLKLKDFLSLDLVLLGLYEGEGKASELPFAALLLGTQNNGYYETITKVGISNKDKIDQIHERVRDSYSTTPSENVVVSDEINKKANSRKIPFTYIPPEKSVVVEAEALNITQSKNWHSCGLQEHGSKAYSLRIPIVREVRLDKKVKDSTTTKQVKELFEEQ